MPSVRFRLLATATAVVAWALVAVGGVVRATASGLGCPHWPLCTSRAVPLAGLRVAGAGAVRASLVALAALARPAERPAAALRVAAPVPAGS